MYSECGPCGWTSAWPFLLPHRVVQGLCGWGTTAQLLRAKPPIHLQTLFHVSLSPLHLPCSSQSLAAHVPSHGPPHQESSHPLPILLPFCLVLTLCQNRRSPNFPIPGRIQYWSFNSDHSFPHQRRNLGLVQTSTHPQESARNSQDSAVWQVQEQGNFGVCFLRTSRFYF